jgi:hypothetical protein
MSRGDRDDRRHAHDAHVRRAPKSVHEDHRVRAFQLSYFFFFIVNPFAQNCIRALL